jgi:hypothetical protein
MTLPPTSRLQPLAVHVGARHHLQENRPARDFSRALRLSAIPLQPAGEVLDFGDGLCRHAVHHTRRAQLVVDLFGLFAVEIEDLQGFAGLLADERRQSRNAVTKRRDTG